MTSLWPEIKNIISQYPSPEDLLFTVIDKNGVLYYVNGAMRHLLDYQNGQNNLVNLFDHISPERLNDFKLTILKSAATGTLQVAGLSIKNGRDRFIDFQVHPLEDTILRKQLFFCIGKDHKNHQQLPETNLPAALPVILYQSLLKQSPDMSWAFDEEERLVYANDPFLNYFCLTAKDLQRNAADVLSEKVIEMLYTKHIDVLNTGIRIETQQKVEFADGTDVTFAISIFRIETNTGLRYIGGIASPMPAFYFEKQLREANERILLLSRATTNAIWEWDMKTGNIFRNDTLMNMIGYSSSRSKGLSWWLRRIHPEDRNRVSEKVKAVTENGLQSWEDEYRIKCSTGEYKHIRDHGYVVYENLLPVKMIGSLQDISELSTLRDELQKEKIKRQQQLSETVIQMQEQERSRISYELHDNINQVISTAKLFADMLNPAGPEQEAAKQQCIDYLVMAIDKVRNLSKELLVPRVNDRGLTESIRVLLSDLTISEKITVHFNHDPENDLLAESKNVTLFRIVQEQLKNILKHSDARRADIGLYYKPDSVKLVIKDNGIGFDAGNTSRGIGLSTIYERTRFYNGSVKIDTAPGKGCVLTVDIPYE